VIGSLNDIIDGYLELLWQMNPVEATFHGRHDFDGLLPRFDAVSVREFLAALRTYTGALEEADADSLEDEIDRTGALHAARHDILVLERERPFATNPAFHLSQALNGLFLLLVRNSQDPVRRSAALLERLRGLPAYLTQATVALTEPDTVLTEMASSMVPGGIALVREGLDDEAVDLSSLDAGALETARSEAAEALGRFGDALAEMAARATDNFAIGRDLFDRKLHTAHMINDNADELLRFGERLRSEAHERLAAVAAEIAPGTPVRDVFRRLRADVPRPAEALDAYGGALKAARDFTVSHRLMTVPDVQLRVMPTPRFLRALVPYAAYQGPGAFDHQQLGLFFVTLPRPGEPWRAHCRGELPATALHEGVPGHHEQMVVANGLSRVVRRVLSTPAAREGWALYCETLMEETGFLATPAERFFYAHGLLWRALRVIIDVCLHTRGMTVQDATAMLRDELGFDEAMAAGEVRRYCAYPTYQLCYAVGRREILRLRDDARQEGGPRFALDAFHDQLLQYGALPTALARWGMGLAETKV